MTSRREHLKQAIVVLLAEGIFEVSDHGSYPRIEYQASMEVGEKDVYSVEWEVYKHTAEHGGKTQYQFFDTKEEAAEFFLKKCEEYYGAFD